MNPPPSTRHGRTLVLLGLGLLLFAISQYAGTWRLSPASDDYLFLDKTRDASFASVWAPRDLVPAYYRPWSRELHFWTIQRLFGTGGTAFRVANLALWIAVSIAFFLLVERIAGTRPAWIACVASAALGGWGAILVWASGAQELWMLLFAIAFLHAFVRGRALLAAAMLLLALLSKETAAMLPLVALAYALIVERATLRDLPRRFAPSVAVVAAWAAFHPLLGGRFWMTVDGVRPFSSPTPVAGAAAAALGSVVNAMIAPSPEHGWAPALIAGAAGALVLGVFVWLGLRDAPPPAPPVPVARERRATKAPAAASRKARGAETTRDTRVATFGVVWALLAWAPLLVPGVGWQTYYGLLGALGAWTTIAVVLARAPNWTAIAVVAALALLRSVEAATPSADWGSEWYQRRSARLTSELRDDLLRRHPSFAPDSRVFLGDLPGGIGLVTRPGRSPAFRTWYRDTSLWVGFLSQYRPRATGDPARDHFLVALEDGRWYELVIGPEDVARAREEYPRWADVHQQLAEIFYRSGDAKRAYAENAKLAEAFPERAEFARNAAVSAREAGDAEGYVRWLARAAAAQKSGAPVTPRP